MRKKLIVIVAIPNALSLDITGPLDVFNTANQLLQDGLQLSEEDGYNIVVASANNELTVPLNNGVQLICSTSVLTIQEPIHTLIIGGYSFENGTDRYQSMIQWLKESQHGIDRVCSICIGAFVLAETGILNGKTATTHWKYTDLLQQQYPLITVDPHPIYVKSSRCYTSAGATTGIDLCLALVEEDYGKMISLAIAKTLVLYVQRHGSQTQYSDLLHVPWANHKTIRDLQHWIHHHLTHDLSVENLALRSAMSTRNFNRIFQSELGITPGKYVEKVRILLVKKYLEETDYSIEKIAALVGFASTDTLGRVFRRTLHLTPMAYRRMFHSPKE